MWFRRGNNVVEVAEVPVVQAPPETRRILQRLDRPEGSTIHMDLPAVELAEYNRLATKLGLEVPGQARMQLLTQLADNQYKVFPFEQVVAFLNQEYRSNHKRWFWRPLTNLDRQKSAFPRWESIHSPEPNGQSILKNAYSKLIPLPVLLHVEKIREFAPEAGIFISDEVEVTDVKDPFLALSLPTLQEMIVVLCWDEPGFGFQKHT